MRGDLPRRSAAVGGEVPGSGQSLQAQSLTGDKWKVTVADYDHQKNCANGTKNAYGMRVMLPEARCNC